MRSCEVSKHNLWIYSLVTNQNFIFTRDDEGKIYLSDLLLSRCSSWSVFFRKLGSELQPRSSKTFWSKYPRTYSIVRKLQFCCYYVRLIDFVNSIHSSCTVIGSSTYKVNESSSALPAPKVLLKDCRISQPEDENVPGHSNGIQVEEHLIDVNTSCHCLYEAVRLWHWPIDEPEWI